MQVCYTIILNFISSQWTSTSSSELRRSHEKIGLQWQSKSEIYGKDLENGYNTIRRSIISKVASQVKKLILVSVSILWLLCTSAIANDEFKWVKGDVAFVSEACSTPNVLFETANLYLTGETENFVKAGQVWADAIQRGECISIAPKQSRVQLVVQIAFFENLHRGEEEVHGELWEVVVMEKGSSGDFEPTTMAIYVGLFSKRFTWSSEPDNYAPNAVKI